MTIKEKNLKLIMELIFIFILPLVVIGINCKLENEYVYDNNGNFETSQKELIYSGIDYNITYRNVIDNFNIWDELWEVGTLNQYGVNASASASIRSKNYLMIIPNTEYYYCVGTGGYLVICYYDADNVFIERLYGADRNHKYISPSNAVYVRFSVISGYGTTYNNDICINVSVNWANGNYVPYGEDLILITSTDVSGQNNIVASPFVNFKNMVAGAFNVNNTDTSFNIIFDYTCLWFLQFVIWHLLYGLFDFLMHLLTLKKKE